MKKKGFTLVELLVVIAILAILATVSIVGYTQFIDKSKANVCLQEAVQVRNMLLADDINNNKYQISNEKIVYSKDCLYTADSNPTISDETKTPAEIHYYKGSSGYEKCTTLENITTTYSKKTDINVAIKAEIALPQTDFGSLYENITIAEDGTVTYTAKNGYKTTVVFVGEIATPTK